MLRKITTLAAVAAVLPLAMACQSDGQNGSASGEAGVEAGASAGTSGESSGGTSASAGGSGGGVLGQIPALVSVNLQNVLNDLAIKLNIDRANIPVNAQIPIAVAANVCGVSINILSVSTGGQAQCTAKTASPELAQSVQQQISAGGSVGGGAQGGSTVTTGTAGSTTGTSGGATGTSATSTGVNQPQTTTPTTPPN